MKSDMPLGQESNQTKVYIAKIKYTLTSKSLCITLFYQTPLHLLSLTVSKILFEIAEKVSSSTAIPPPPAVNVWTTQHYAILLTEQSSSKCIIMTVVHQRQKCLTNGGDYVKNSAQELKTCSIQQCY